VALLGVHISQAMHMTAPTASAVNDAVARFATRWIAGPSREGLIQALRARNLAP
jgi:hypothetical protein